jgi:transcription elongation factor S-II
MKVKDSDEEYAKVKVVQVEQTCYRLNKNSRDAYTEKMRSILANLMRKGSPLCEQIMNNLIQAEELVTKDISEFASDEIKEKRLAQEKNHMEMMRTDFGIEERIKKGNGFYRCPKCKSNSTDFFLLQTRSSDEPMTTFANCFACNNHWKF